MALFDDIDKSQISELFETKKVAKIDPEGFNIEQKSVEFEEPSKQTFNSKDGKFESPDGRRFNSKFGEVESPEGLEAQERLVEYDPGQEPLIETKNVVSEGPNKYTSDTKFPVYESSEDYKSEDKLVVFNDPNGYNVETDQVVKIDGQEVNIDTKLVTFEDSSGEEFKTPNGISVPVSYTPEDSRKVVAESPNQYSSDTKDIKADTPDGYQAETQLVQSEPASGPTDSETSGVAIQPNDIEIKTPEVKYNDPKGYSSAYEYYTEGESSKKGLNTPDLVLTTQPYEVTTPRAQFDIEDPSLKQEFYSYLGRMMKGSTNFDNYSFHNFKGFIDQLSSNFGGTGLRDAYTEGERIYQSFESLVNAWKKGGFKGALTNLFSQMNENTPVPVQSDAIVPAINRFVDSLPIIGLFTKQKYSLDLNQKTYAHEEVYNKAVDYQKEALKMYEGGMYGLYWYAKFYANHNIPTDKQEIILGKMSGNPAYSRPDYKIFAGFTDYLKVIGDAADISSRAEYVNLEDFTSSDPDRMPFKKVFELSRPAITIDDSSKRAKVDLTKKKQTIWRGNKARLDEDLKYKIGNPENPKRREEVQFDTVYRHDQISPKFNTSKIGTTSISPNSSTLIHKRVTEDSKRSSKLYRGWAEYEIETLGGISTTTAGAIYVDPQQWTEIAKIQAGKKISSLEDYEKYRSQLDEELTTVINQEIKDPDNIYYGYYPYKWSQVFSDFEISSNGNWNVALSEFSGECAEFSMFVPKNRPTYGKWNYMPIISYEFMDKDLNSTSIPVSESLNLQIPSTMAFVSTLQLTFIDDRYDRIFNWFVAYTNSIYGVYDNYVKPYKNCCMRCVIDILDWDRTILKRMKYIIVPSHFTQQYIGENDHAYKTVSVTFSVVGEISNSNWKPQ